MGETIHWMGIRGGGEEGFVLNQTYFLWAGLPLGKFQLLFLFVKCSSFFGGS